MRLVLSLTALVLSACNAGPPRQIDQIEVSDGGNGVGVRSITVNRQGQGNYVITQSVAPEERRGTFPMPPDQFAQLAERLTPYLAQAEPMTRENAMRAMRETCPGMNYVTEQGGVWIHWTGPDLDMFYSADFGCEPDRNRRRNDDLDAIADSLPVPNLN